MDLISAAKDIFQTIFFQPLLKLLQHPMHVESEISVYNSKHLLNRAYMICPLIFVIHFQVHYLTLAMRSMSNYVSE